MKQHDLTAGAVALVILTGAALLGQINFSRWDNMETFLPAIWYAHTQLLHGRFPFWNPLQNLGEPLHALGIAGTFYPPYTIAVALTKLAHWPQAYALDVSAILHAAFAAIGVSKLLTELGVRRSIAFAAALSTVFSGYVLIVGAVWVHVLPNLAWSVWALWAFQRIVLRGPTRSSVVTAIIALTAVLLTGHLQMAANVWLAVWLWTLSFAALQKVLGARLPLFLGIAVAAALLAAPAVLPTAFLLPDADRFTGQLPAGPGFGFNTMIGLLIPTIGASDGAVSSTVLVTTFMGAWVVPALLLGGAAAAFRRQNIDRTMLHLFAVTIASALVFVWLNLGPQAGLYSLLHALPVWSHFRIPFKYFERALPLLVIAAAIGLELAVRNVPPRRYAHVLLLLAVFAAVMWLTQPADEPLAWFTGTTALVTIGAAALISHERFARLLVPLVVLQSIGLLALANSPHQFKAYRADREKNIALPLAGSAGRVLSLSEGSEQDSSTRALGRFYAATLDGYASASGHRFALTSARFQKYFPALLSGVPQRPALPFTPGLSAAFLRNLNVRYLVVDRSDAFSLNAVRSAFPAASVAETPRAQVYHLPVPDEPVWFATERVPATDSTIVAALTSERGRPAAIDYGEARSLPTGEIANINWESDRIRAHVQAPTGSLLVFSTSYSPEWVASVDGRRVDLLPVDGFLTGVPLPGGAQEVLLRVRRWPLYLSLGLAAIGVLITLLTVRSVPPRREQLQRVPHSA